MVGKEQGCKTWDENICVNEPENFESSDPLSPWPAEVARTLPLKSSALSLREDAAEASTLRDNICPLQIYLSSSGTLGRTQGQVTTPTSWGSERHSKRGKEVGAQEDVGPALCPGRSQGCLHGKVRVLNQGDGT